LNDPIVFISRNRIKPGRLAEFRQHYQASIPPIQAGKPGTLAQLAYENEDATQVTIVRFFPDADALDQQIQGADERSKKTYAFIEPLAIEIYGRPNPAALEKMRSIAGSGITVHVHPRYIGGFIR
jgi:quinol monooxygenase YgiN